MEGRNRAENLLKKVFGVEVGFSFIVKTDFTESHHRFDQCGIVIYLDSDNWLKASVEYENDTYQHLGSVVTNDGYSDWATTASSPTDHSFGRPSCWAVSRSLRSSNKRPQRSGNESLTKPNTLSLLRGCCNEGTFSRSPLSRMPPCCFNHWREYSKTKWSLPRTCS